MLGKFKNFIGTKLFVCFIFLFPLLIEAIIFYTDKNHAALNWNDFESLLNTVAIVIKEKYIAFYATALTITFTVYSFNKTQRNNEEQRRIDAQEQEKERKKEVDAEFKLRQKELEAKRDFYRPTFVIEKDPNDGNKYVKLLMRSDNLYLEDINYYSPKSTTDQGMPHRAISKKSGDIIGKKITKSFYITAKTQIGETILFGFFNDGIKIHKYLREKGNALLPRESYNKNFQTKIDENWGTYNTDTGDSNKILDQILFFNTVEIREKLVFNFYQSIENTLSAKSVNDMYQTVFQEIVNEYKESRLFENNKINETVLFLLGVVKEQYDCFETSNKDIKWDYMEKQLKKLSDYNYKKEISKILSEDKFDLSEFTSVISQMLCKYCTLATSTDEQTEKNDYEAILTMLMEVFSHVTVHSNLDTKLLYYKAEVFNMLS